MTKINIFSGFLGAGKTTLIQKLIEDGFKDKIALIENEFGEIAIDGGFMKEAGVDTLYLVTSHTSFYERYGWEFYCFVKEESGNETRMYIHRG